MLSFFKYSDKDFSDINRFIVSENILDLLTKSIEKKKTSFIGIEVIMNKYMPDNCAMVFDKDNKCIGILKLER